VTVAIASFLLPDVGVVEPSLRDFILEAGTAQRLAADVIE
jgi:hypothetical protein